MTEEPTSKSYSNRIAAINIDENSIAKANSDVEHEREVAIFDILDGNVFALQGIDKGPYQLNISIADDRLIFTVFSDKGGDQIIQHAITMTPLKRLLKDYFLILGSYYQAIRSGQPSRIQSIDEERRGLHDEGSRLLMDKLSGKIEIDFDTARRLFTLVSALHWKG
ncbi:MAG: UPF0262 family protein [Hyphomicrobium sp.]